MKKRAKKQTRKKRARKVAKYVVVSNRGYGSKLKGTRIYFEGNRPPGLRNDGSVQFGKHILETLSAKFDKFRWIITEGTDGITTEYGIVRVRTSQTLLKRMSRENWDRARDIKNDIVRRFFSVAFPQQFTDPTKTLYVPGTLARIVDNAIVPRLSSEDKEAVVSFLPDFLASEAAASVNQLKATAQIKTLKLSLASAKRCRPAPFHVSLVPIAVQS